MICYNRGKGRCSHGNKRADSTTRCFPKYPLSRFGAGVLGKRFFSSWPHASRSGRSLLRYRSPSHCHRQKSQASSLWMVGDMVTWFALYWRVKWRQCLLLLWAFYQVESAGLLCFRTWAKYLVQTNSSRLGPRRHDWTDATIFLGLGIVSQPGHDWPLFDQVLRPPPYLMQRYDARRD